MTTAVRDLLAHFEQLSKPEQHEAVREILQRAVLDDSPSLTDAELAAVADETFLEFDRREANP